MGLVGDTEIEHRNASGFRYLCKLYPEAEGLRPVLDTIIWPRGREISFHLLWE